MSTEDQPKATRKSLRKSIETESPNTRLAARKRSASQAGDLEQPAAKKMSKAEEMSLATMVGKLAKTVNDMNKNMARREDISDLKDHFSEKIEDNRREIQKLHALRKEDEDKLEGKILKVVEGATPMAPGTNDRESRQVDLEERTAFYRCRKSVRIWPVVQTTDGLLKDVCQFLRLVLLIPHEVIQGLKIEKMERQVQTRRSKINDEVLVQLASSKQRDIVQSYALNLSKMAGKAGLRMEIPHHLEGAFKVMEEHAGLLNKKFPGTKRSIKFDDIAMSLSIDIKLPSDDQWHKFSYRQIKHAAEIRQANEQKEMNEGNTDNATKRILMTNQAEAHVVVSDDEDTEEH